MRGSQRNCLVVVLVGLSLALPRLAAAQEKPASTEKTSDEEANLKKLYAQAKLDKEFQDKLSGCVLTGQFSIVGRGADDKPPRAEKYTISKVSKLPNGLWLFESRMQYGKNDLTIPLPLKVIWAGDTPIITLTDMTIPGLGTFTARVMIYGDRYAGTWQHDKVGGHLWGTIEKAKEPDTDPSKPATAPDAKPDTSK